MDKANRIQDVTNHQINHLTLIQNFVSFKQSKVLRVIATGDIDIYGSYAWFDSYRTPDDIPAFSREGGIWKFFRAFLDLLRHSNRESPTPDTLELDNDRIADIRTKLLNVINISLCLHFFNIIDETIIPLEIPAGQGRTHISSKLWSASHTIKRNRRLHVGSALSAIVDDYSAPGIDSSSASTSSPLNLDSWKVATPALTLEMLRHANRPLPNKYFEETVAETLSNPLNQEFRTYERSVFARLGALVQKYVPAWQSLDSVALYKVAPVCPGGCKIHAKPAVMDPLDEVARRIAHLGILHWNVWGNIVYLVDPNEQPNHPTEVDWGTGELTN